MASSSRSGARCRFSWALLLFCACITAAAGRRDLRVEVEDKITGPDAKLITSGYPINALVQVLDYDNGGGGACTGTLVAPSQVLTAGHCCVDPNRNPWPPDGFRILLGAYSIAGGGTLDSFAEPQTGGIVTSVTAVHVPPGYKTQDYWDVCILTLTQADARVKPAVLVPSNESANLDLISAFEYGWGIQQPFSGINSVNQLMGIELRTNSCAGHDFAPVIQNWPDGSPQWVCVDKPATLGGACNGDSGGPLLVGNSILATLSAGLNTGNSITFPIACDGPTQYTDIYINLAGPPVNAWITDTLQNKTIADTPDSASPAETPESASPAAAPDSASPAAAPDSASPAAAPPAGIEPPLADNPPAAESPPPDISSPPAAPPLLGRSFPAAGPALPDTTPPPGSLPLPAANVPLGGLPPTVTLPLPLTPQSAADLPPTGHVVYLDVPPSEFSVQAQPPPQALPAHFAPAPPREPSRGPPRHHHPDDSRHPGSKPEHPHPPPAPKHGRPEHGEEPPAGGVSRVEKGTGESPAPPEGFSAEYSRTPPAISGDSRANGGAGGRPSQPASGGDPPPQEQDVPLPLELATEILDGAVESIVQG